MDFPGSPVGPSVVQGEVDHGILKANPKAGMEIRGCELFLEERK